MQVFLRLFMLVAMGWVAALSAQHPVSPQDPAFLNSFNDHQKSAIHRFLSEGLGKTIDTDNVPVNEDDLKELHTQYLKQLRNKFGAALSKSHKHKKKSSKQIIQGCDCFHCHDRPKRIPSTIDYLNTKLITSRDIGTKGTTIKTGGFYTLEAPSGVFYWNPDHIANVITIDADNVILDLGQVTIVQLGRNNFASTAIQILPGHKNITIRNGGLAGFTADAIVATSTNNLVIENISITDNQNRLAFSPNLFFASVNIQSAVNVILRDITIANTVINSPTDILIGAGFLLFNIQAFQIANCEVVAAEVDATTISQCVGISTILCNDGVIDNCRVSKCVSSGIMPAFGYIVSQSILTQNCSGSYNTGVQTTSGYYPQLSDSLKYINCEANNNHSTCQDCHGFPYFISTNGFFSNCRASNNIAMNPSGNFNEKVTGFEILVCANCIVEGCEAYNNSTTNPIRHYAAGFANGNSSNVVFRNCISIGNSAIGNSGRGVGFGPALDPRFFGPSTGTLWENCVAEGNLGDTQSIGFDLFGQIGAVLTASVSQNHGSSLIDNGIGILSNGPYDEGNPVDVPCNVVPIIVMTANAENNVLVKDNIVANNSFAGIVDTTSANNMYVGNTVFNNGSNFVGPIFTDGTPIRNWTVQSAPSNANNNGVVGDKLDNLNGTTP